MATLINTNGEHLQGAPKPISNVQASTALRKLELIEPDKVKPTEFNVLLRVVSVEEMTEGGVLKPESFFEKEMFAKTSATLVACGDECFTNSKGDYWERLPKVGDLVMTSKYAGNVYRDSEQNLYRFAHDKDIIAIIEEA